MAFSDDDLLPISALQHLVYCPRQCALIHVERLWAENQFTAEGRVLHERAHENKTRKQGSQRIARGVLLRSLELGLFGQADIVEFHPAPSGDQAFPVEYKRGRPKSHDADRIQLCAQALCLEEMIGREVPAGALFYGKTRRRVDVLFDSALRGRTLDAIRQLRQLIDHRQTPPARYDKARCGRCSLRRQCMPEVLEGSESATRYLSRSIAAILHEGPADDW
ncbi:MAG: CRISPR-associated protein Cas4 [Planctomycetota bacterium]|nr:CRISPR-associated protein Cas4 [Planctomycetota bacterium]